MKKIFKNIIIVSIVLCMLTGALGIGIKAATFDGSSVLTFSTNQPIKVGDEITIKANFSATEKMEILEQAFLTYNPNILEYLGGNSNCNEITKGKLKIYTDNPNGKTHTESFKFKAIAIGSSSIALENILFLSMDEVQHSIEGASGVSITVTNPSTQASSNTNLKNISTSSGTLTPKFNPDVTSYSVTIANDVEELWLSVSKGDSKQTYVVEGSRNMKVGQNKRVVVVTAENGDTKKYTVNITRLDANGQMTEPPTEDEPLNDLSEVVVDDQTMYVEEDLTGAELPSGFTVIEYAFDGKTIPALSDDTYIILMLRLPDNSASGFYVYDNDGVFTKLITLAIGGQIFHIMPTDEVPDGYSAVNDFTIGEVTVPAYKSDKAGLGDFALVYAKGPGGQTGFYSYDTVDNTIQRVVEPKEEEKTDEAIGDTDKKTDIITSFMELNTNGKIVVITILAIIILLIAAVVVLIIKIASSSKADDDFEEEDFEEEIFDEENGIVGFEYVSVEDNNTDIIEEETEDENEENIEDIEE